MPSFVITHLDVGPPELADALPMRARVARVMPGPDRPDYVLCYTENTLNFRLPAGFDLNRVDRTALAADAPTPILGVHWLVICTRLLGAHFHSGMSGVAINIAYVVDPSLIQDAAVDFTKLEYAAIGFIDDSPIDVRLPGETARAE